MQMIPDYVEWFPSGAERMVHELLSGCPRLEGYALHSLNVARHRTKIWGEIDFILVRPFGIIALEIKGSQLLREGGRWYQRDIRNGDERAIERKLTRQADRLKVEFPWFSRYTCRSPLGYSM